MASKKAAIKTHARKRFMQRYGLTLSRRVHDHMVQQIQTGKSILIDKQSLRVTVRDVTFDGNVYRVVYDNKRHCIVTVLPHRS
jgi:hypothetical protein